MSKNIRAVLPQPASPEDMFADADEPETDTSFNHASVSNRPTLPHPSFLQQFAAAATQQQQLQQQQQKPKRKRALDELEDASPSKINTQQPEGEGGDAPTYKICTHQGCTNIVKNARGLCTKHNEVSKKRKVKRCSFEGCTNQVQKHGVCVRHGAGKVHRICCVEGCNTRAIRGGLCPKHTQDGGEGSEKKKADGDAGDLKLLDVANDGSATEEELREKLRVANKTISMLNKKVKKLQEKNINLGNLLRVKEAALEKAELTILNTPLTTAAKGSSKKSTAPPPVITDEYEHKTTIEFVTVDTKDGPKRKRLCSVVGCVSQSIRGGVCGRHGAKYPCTVQGCTNHRAIGKLCIKHGAKTKRCPVEGCTKNRISGGFCLRHGGKRHVYYCKHEGCPNQSVKGGVCVTHGAKTRCSVSECTKFAVQGGVCIKHGAKVKRVICNYEGCTNKVIARGKCQRHDWECRKEQIDGLDTTAYDDWLR